MPTPLTRWLPAVILGAVLGASPAGAALARLGGDFALDSEVSCAAGEPRLAALEGGRMVAVWWTQTGLWARRFDAIGQPLSAQATLVAAGSTAFHQVVPLAGGGFAVVWFDLARTQIVQRRANADGELAAPVDVLPPERTGEGINGLAATAGLAGRIGISFAQSGAVYFRELGAGGVPSSPVVDVVAYGDVTGGDTQAIAPAIVSAPGGAYRTFWITWGRFFGEPARPQGTISGRVLRPPFAAADAGPYIFVDHTATSLAGVAAADGSYLLAWTTPGDLPLVTAAAEAQRFTASDQAAAPPVTLDAAQPFAGAVTAAAAPQGGFAVAWEGPSTSPSGGYNQIYLHLLRADGSPTGAVEPVEAPDAIEGPTSPSLAFLASGQLVVAWNAASCNLCDPPPCLSGRLRAQRLAVGCGAGSGVLCLAGGRFEATLDFADPRRQLAGTGVPVQVTADTGYFWFFAPGNLEVLVKVIDGRALNGHYWIFWGGLTDVGFRLTVRDTVTGASRSYDSPPGTFASAADTEALAASPTAADAGDVEVHELATAGLDRLAFTVPLAAADLVPALAPATQWPAAKSGEAPPCTHPALAVITRPGLCLGGHRFEVEVRWSADGIGSGPGVGVPLSDDTGAFWFFYPTNLELVVKVLDGRAVNGRFWVFYGALTNVAYDLVVRHAEDGTEWTHHNVGGSFGSGADVDALQPPPTCTCPAVFEPVCGRDGRVYGNACEAHCVGWVGVDPLSLPPDCEGF